MIIDAHNHADWQGYDLKKNLADMDKKYRIIDFHTHPFFTDEHNICSHIAYCDMSAENTEKDLKTLGIEKICGSVIKRVDPVKDGTGFDAIKAQNDKALELRDFYKGFFVPGFHVHPDFVKESIAEIERMQAQGVKLIGELVPYYHGWANFADKRLWDILEVADHYKMIVDFHALGTEDMYNQMDQMVDRFKNIIFVGAHPSEGECLKHHFKRFESNPNYYIDLSGGGLFRHGMLRHAIDDYGKERILFGSDFPTCNAGMFVGGVALDYLISEEEKEYIFYKNAVRILDLKD